eukprot:GHVL01023972.1.p1 GENE.GHVL01023972.1~~GHVL01023972.1.p1  ORF type:complete len:108 (-),score=11.83 GHVL01023972.1:355-633(-)
MNNNSVLLDALSKYCCGVAFLKLPCKCKSKAKSYSTKDQNSSKIIYKAMKSRSDVKEYIKKLVKLDRLMEWTSQFVNFKIIFFSNHCREWIK